MKKETKNRKKQITKVLKFLSDNKKKASVVCLAVVVAGALTALFVYKHKDKVAQKEPSGLIDQYRKQLPELKKKSENGSASDLQQYGIALYATGDFAKAEEVYKKQAQQDEKNPMVHNNLANALRDQKKFEEAIAEYQKAIELNPKSTNTYLNLASVYQYSLNDFDKAMEVYKKAIESDSQNVDFLNMAALAWEQHGDTEKAKEYFQKVLQIQDSNQAAKAGMQRIEK